MKKGRSKLLLFIIVISLYCTSITNSLFAEDTSAPINAGVDSRPAVALGTTAIRNKDHVYFGKYLNTPVDWLVLDAEKSNANATDGMFMVSDRSLWHDPGNYFCDSTKPDICTRDQIYNNDQSGLARSSSDYTISKVRAELETNPNSFRQNINNFSLTEQNAILSTTKSDVAFQQPEPFLDGSTVETENFYNGYVGPGKTNGRAATNILNQDKLFLLSVEEAYTYMSKQERSSGMSWFLRTGNEYKMDGLPTRSVGYVRGNTAFAGKIDTKFSNEQTPIRQGDGIYIRPGMNIDKRKVLYTSSALSDKSKTLHTIGYESFNQWKVTIKDESSSFKASTSVDSHAYTTIPIGRRESITFHHGALQSINGSYNNLVAMITDNTGNLIYYGSVNNDVTATTTTVQLPDDIGIGNYRISLFAEAQNNGYDVDFASDAFTLDFSMIADGTLSSIQFLEGDVAFTSFNPGFAVPTMYHEGTTFVLPNGNNVTKDGFLFGGWFNNKECTGKPIAYIADDMTGNKTYYAKWIALPSTSNVSLGTSLLKTNDKLYYGKYDEIPILWNILDADKSSNNISGNAFLYADKTIYNDKPFDTAIVNNVNAYKAGDLKKRLETNVDSFRKKIDHFSLIEQDGMMVTTKSDFYDKTISSSKAQLTYDIENAVDHEKMFLLSVDELIQYYQLDVTNPDVNKLIANDLKTDLAQRYLTRSVVSTPEFTPRIRLYMITNSGNWECAMYGLASLYGVRPGFNLDKEKVIFLSSTTDQKPSMLKAVAQPSNTWKTTLHDGNDFSEGTSIDIGTNAEAYAGNKLKVHHQALKKINKDYTNLTAVISDESGRYVLYYGSISTDTAATETTITLPDNLLVGNYKLQLYGEKWNDKNETDYASKPFTANLKIIDETISSITYMDGDIAFNSFVNGYTAPISYIEGVEMQLPSGSYISKPGYVFEGWYQNRNLSGQPITSVSKTTKGNVTYYAKWSQNHTHHYATSWTKDRYHHWHECTCNDKQDIARHVESGWIEDRKATTSITGMSHRECTICGYVLETKETPILPTQEAKPKTETTSVDTISEETPAKVEETTHKQDKKFVEDTKTGIKIESVNGNSLFSPDTKIELKKVSNDEFSKVKVQKDNVITVFNIVLKENNIKIEKLDSKVRVYIDAKDYEQYKNLKLYKMNADGDYEELSYTIQDDKIVFECDALDTYVLTGDKKKATGNSDVIWWVIIATIILLAGSYLVFRKFRKEKSST